MKTPEEILKEKLGSNIPAWIDYKVIEAMSDYAKQEAERFAEWIYRNNWEQINIGIYANPQEGHATTAQLYKLYTLFKTEQKDEK
jgi:hypothetical protein